jgi:hypothetical protein
MHAHTSSSTSNFELLRIARERQKSCCCPSEKFEPLAATAASNLPARPSTVSAMWHSRNASQSWRSVCTVNGSKLERMVPLNMTGSCGMIAMRRRSSVRFRMLVSIPSIRTDPSVGLTRRKRVMMREDLPEPGVKRRTTNKN